MNAPTEYLMSLSTSGKLKMKAKALLAAGSADERFEASVLLHEAARTERRAVEALTSSSPATRLAALVEECGCLLDGYDPVGAARAWAQIVSERKQVDAPTAAALLSRLEPRFAKTHDAYAKAIAPLMGFITSTKIVPETKRDQVAAGEALARATERFPGVTGLWWATYRMAEARRDPKTAWEAITRARQLEPENKTFEAFRLFAASWALTPTKADAELARVSSRLDTLGSRACLMYALAELRLARRIRGTRHADASERWCRARTAARTGLAQAPEGKERSHLRAVELLATSLIEGETPTVELLYLAGLSDVAMAAPRHVDMVELISDTVRQAA